MSKREELFGSSALNDVDQRGIRADAAPRRVTNPKIFVISF
jgi:hypothetical protein